MDLSVIIPFVGEYPQVLWTIQSIAQSLIPTDIEFEIIAVDNHCSAVLRQCNIATIQAIKKLDDLLEDGELDPEDVWDVCESIPDVYKNRSGNAIKACERGNPWLKYVEYPDALSHWQAKRAGIAESTGEVLLFADAHVVPSARAIPDMYNQYLDMYIDEGTMHLPLTYKILEYSRLIYKIFIEGDYYYSYKFTRFAGGAEDPFEVPCMSTCGMMISREIYDKIGGWPATLGIYGGGENFMNYTLAVCGYKKFIYPNGTLFHHGDRRDYYSDGDDTTRNRMLAHYIFGGERLLNNFTGICKGDPRTLQMLKEQAVREGGEQRQLIKSIQKISIEEWTKEWI